VAGSIRCPAPGGGKTVVLEPESLSTLRRVVGRARESGRQVRQVVDAAPPPPRVTQYQRVSRVCPCFAAELSAASLRVASGSPDRSTFWRRSTYQDFCRQVIISVDAHLGLTGRLAIDYDSATVWAQCIVNCSQGPIVVARARSTPV
jgi:hypothetical protein